MRDVLSDGIRRVGGGVGGGRGTSLRLRVAGGHSEVTPRWTTSAPVSNEMHTEAGGGGALGAGVLRRPQPRPVTATIIFLSARTTRVSVQIHTVGRTRLSRF